jgi:hypothetical protein
MRSSASGGGSALRSHADCALADRPSGCDDRSPGSPEPTFAGPSPVDAQFADVTAFGGRGGPSVLRAASQSESVPGLPCSPCRRVAGSRWYGSCGEGCEDPGCRGCARRGRRSVRRRERVAADAAGEDQSRGVFIPGRSRRWRSDQFPGPPGPASDREPDHAGMHQWRGTPRSHTSQ